MKRGDVVLMVVPGDLGRPRPGVVVQADELGDDTTTVLVCPLSSDVRPELRIRPIIGPDTDNGLLIASQIMTDKMLALKRDRIRGVIGHIDPHTREALDGAIIIVLGLMR